MKKYFYNVLIVGCGCAGLACALKLSRLGVNGVAIVCENRYYGTSRNTGSDKQTYYKLSLSGKEKDSVLKMAEEMYSNGGIEGDSALVEAAGSVEGFMNLVALGVPFPKNEYGEFIGYKTDHDPCARGTSAGPLTSKYMTEALEGAVKLTDTKIIEGLSPVKIIKKDKKAVGCAFEAKGEKAVIFCNHLVFASGGEAAMYKSSVYPKSQFGAMGVIIDAGVELSNFNCLQYGIASTGFRWNLSGSYQQAIPRYINDKGEEFLRKNLSDIEIIEYTFLKGYEWPFDTRKIGGSSKIDLLIKEENDKGCKVYLDYTNNPSGFSLKKLGGTAKNYLGSSSALLETPIKRLKALNNKAYLLFKDNQIDLENELLPIAVCAQHQNGGARVDTNYETNIENLYVIGEAAGVFGAYRPGGSALNSTQVGAIRCAESIFMRDDGNKPLEAEADFSIQNDEKGLIKKWQAITDKICMLKRDEAEILSYLDELENDLKSCRSYREKEVLTATKALYISCAFACRDTKNNIVLYKDGECRLKAPKPIPDSHRWFETEWKKYNERMGI